MLMRRLRLGETLLPASALNLPIAALIVLAALSWIDSINRDASLWAMLRLLLYAAVFYLTLEITESRRQTKRLIQIVVGMGLIVSFLGLVKYSGAPFPSFWKGGDLSSLNSTFVNHNHLGGYLAMIFTLGLGVSFHRTTERVLIWTGALLLILVALCLSMSRGAWIGIFVAVELMLILFMVRKEISRLKIGIVASAFFMVVGVTLLGSNPMIARLETLENPENELSGRMVAWSGCVEIIEKSPFLGTGLGTFPWSFTAVRPAGLTERWREAHNDWLQIVTELGLPALVPLIWGLALVFRTGLRAYKTTPSRLHAGAVLGALGGITAILVHSISDFNIQITSNGILFACLIGLVMGKYSWAGGQWSVVGGQSSEKTTRDESVSKTNSEH
jgi:O-antigen ligase